MSSLDQAAMASLPAAQARRVSGKNGELTAGSSSFGRENFVVAVLIEIGEQRRATGERRPEVIGISMFDVRPVENRECPESLSICHRLKPPNGQSDRYSGPGKYLLRQPFRRWHHAPEGIRRCRRQFAAISLGELKPGVVCGSEPQPLENRFIARLNFNTCDDFENRDHLQLPFGGQSGHVKTEKGDHNGKQPYSPPSRQTCCPPLICNSAPFT